MPSWRITADTRNGQRETRSSMSDERQSNRRTATALVPSTREKQGGSFGAGHCCCGGNPGSDSHRGRPEPGTAHGRPEHDHGRDRSRRCRRAGAQDHVHNYERADVEDDSNHDIRDRHPNYHHGTGDYRYGGQAHLERRLPNQAHRAPGPAGDSIDQDANGPRR